MTDRPTEVDYIRHGIKSAGKTGNTGWGSQTGSSIIYLCITPRDGTSKGTWRFSRFSDSRRIERIQLNFIQQCYYVTRHAKFEMMDIKSNERLRIPSQKRMNFRGPWDNHRYHQQIQKWVAQNFRFQAPVKLFSERPLFWGTDKKWGHSFGTSQHEQQSNSAFRTLTDPGQWRVARMEPNDD